VGMGSDIVDGWSFIINSVPRTRVFVSFVRGTTPLLLRKIGLPGGGGDARREDRQGVSSKD